MDRRIARVDCREDARGNVSRRADSQAGIGAGGDVRVQRGGSLSLVFVPRPIGLHVSQADYIPKIGPINRSPSFTKNG